MKRLLILLSLCFSLAGYAAEDAGRFTQAASEQVRFTGRAARGDDGSLSFDWSGSHFTFRFEGTRCLMRAADTKRNYYNVFVDGQPYGKVTVEGPVSDVLLAEGLPRGPHTVTVQKRTEAEQGRTTFFGVVTDGPLLALPPAPARLIEFIGDSHTCGYGTEGKTYTEPFTPETENCDLAWGCITARLFGADYVLIAHSGQGVVRNWGDKKEVSDRTMRERVAQTFDMEELPVWDFRSYTPDIVVIKLGTNDFSTGISPSETDFGESFSKMYGLLREQYGPVPILYVVPREAEPYYRYLRGMAQRLGDGNLHCMMHSCAIHNGTDDLGAGYHPNYRGQCKMAVAVIPYIATITGWEMPFPAAR